MRALVARSLVLVVAVVPTASGAARAEPPATMMVAGRVLELAADRGRVAMLTAPGACRRPVDVWRPGGTPVRLRAPGVATCFGGAVTGLGLAGGRAAWVETAVGHGRETELVTASLRRPRPVRLAWERAQYQGELGGPSVGAARGGGDVLVFTTIEVCGPPLELDDDRVEVPYPCPAGSEPGDVTRATLWRVARARRSVAAWSTWSGRRRACAGACGASAAG